MSNNSEWKIDAKNTTKDIIQKHGTKIGNDVSSKVVKCLYRLHQRVDK